MPFGLKQNPTKAFDLWFFRLLNIVLFPITSLLVMCFDKIHARNFEGKKMTDEELEYSRRLKKMSAKVAQIELGLESVYQVVGQLVIKCFVMSNTRAEEGLAHAFSVDRHDRSQMFWLSLSIAWSFIVCVKSYVEGLAGPKIESGIEPTVMAGIFATLSMLLKTYSTIILFTPSLGLYSLLHHYLGSKTPYTPGMTYYYSMLDKGTYGGGTVAYKNIVDTHYTSLIDYTHFDWWQCFIAFLVVSTIQALLIGIVKYCYSTAFRKLNVFDMAMHCWENTNIPYATQDWEEENGSVQQHRERQKKVQMEVYLTIGINFFCHFLYSIPFICFGKTMNFWILVDLI